MAPLTIRDNLPPQINVIGTVFFTTAILLVLFGAGWERWHDLLARRRREARGDAST